MSHSTKRVDFVLVYEPILDKARWLTISDFSRMSAVNPTLELINQSNIAYETILKLAGPKPVVILKSSEDYSAGT